MSGSKIMGYGAALPSLKVTNDDLTRVMDTQDTWIVERTGIMSRYFSEYENTSDLGARAAQVAILDSGIDPKQIDLILVATITPDSMMPSTACLIQAKLGLNDQKCMAFDVNAACSGFMIALQTADAYLRCNLAHTALIIGAETLSKVLDFNDRGSAILFGDGAGALLIQQDDQTKKMVHFAQSKGDLEEVLTNEVTPLNPSMNLQQTFKGYLRMKGQAVYRFAVSAVQDGIEQVLKERNYSINQIDWIVPHQANLRIIQHVAEKMGIEMSKFYTNLDEVGNTSSASIPIVLAKMHSEGILKQGQKIILVGFGAGLTWASALVEL